MKRILIGLILLLFIRIEVGRAQIRSNDRDAQQYREWRYQNRQDDTAAKVALEQRLTKIEEGQANIKEKLAWLDKIIWGTVLGMCGILGKEALMSVMLRKEEKERKRGTR